MEGRENKRKEKVASGIRQEDGNEEGNQEKE